MILQGSLLVLLDPKLNFVFFFKCTLGTFSLPLIFLIFFQADFIEVCELILET